MYFHSYGGTKNYTTLTMIKSGKLATKNVIQQSHSQQCQRKFQKSFEKPTLLEKLQLNKLRQTSVEKLQETQQYNDEQYSYQRGNHCCWRQY